MFKVIEQDGGWIIVSLREEKLNREEVHNLREFLNPTKIEELLSLSNVFENKLLPWMKTESRWERGIGSGYISRMIPRKYTTDDLKQMETLLQEIQSSHPLSSLGECTSDHCEMRRDLTPWREIVVDYLAQFVANERKEVKAETPFTLLSVCPGGMLQDLLIIQRILDENPDMEYFNYYLIGQEWNNYFNSVKSIQSDFDPLDFSLQKYDLNTIRESIGHIVQSHRFSQFTSFIENVNKYRKTPLNFQVVAFESLNGLATWLKNHRHPDLITCIDYMDDSRHQSIELLHRISRLSKSSFSLQGGVDHVMCEHWRPPSEEVKNSIEGILMPESTRDIIIQSDAQCNKSGEEFEKFLSLMMEKGNLSNERKLSLLRKIQEVQKERKQKQKLFEESQMNGGFHLEDFLNNHSDENEMEEEMWLNGGFRNQTQSADGVFQADPI